MNTRKRILVVDDTPTNIQILVEVLKEDYDLSVATNGAKALTLAQGPNTPDIVLLDVMMEDMDGYEVCRRLKEDVRTAGIPVIFVTALNQESDEARGLELGAVDYITKPIQPDIVRARIRNHLELKAYRDDLERLVDEQVKRIANSHLTTIFALSKLAESRDDDTGRHLERTQTYCKMLAARLLERNMFADVVNEEFVETIFWASPLHDMGKVAIPDEVLRKRGGLNDAEYKVMKTHAARGFETLSKVTSQYPDNAFLNMGSAIARSHHEWWNGGGYPDGLRGEQIPLAARVMALADVYDALTSERCYKRAFSHQEALSIMQSESGTHFDPELTAIFVEMEQEIDQARRSFHEPQV